MQTVKKQLIAQFYHKNKLLFFICILGTFIDAGLGLVLSWILQQLIDTASGVKGAIDLAVLAKISIGFMLICFVFLFIDALAQPRFVEKALRQYKDFAFKKLMDKHMMSFQTGETSGYLSLLTNDVTNVESGYVTQYLALCKQMFTFLGALLMMLFYSPIMTGIAILLMLLPLAVSVLSGGKMADAEQRVSEGNKNFTSILMDCLGGFLVIKSFHAEESVQKLFSESNRYIEGQKRSKAFLRKFVESMGSVAGITAQLGVFIASTYMAVRGFGLTPGVVIVFVNLMGFLIQPLAQLPSILASRHAAVGLIDKLASQLTEEIPKDREQRIEGVNKGIRMEHVFFAYEEDKNVLCDVNLCLEAGKSYAIVGASGSGKSTLLQLLMSSRDDYRGHIFIDDTELRQIHPSALCDLFSVIAQNVFIFNDSIRNNITMFGDFSDQEVYDVVRRAHLQELVDARGLDFPCEEGGKALSGGERQRISIARSLLKKSKVLLADESTAALDAKTAHLVSQDILNLSGLTRIVVTHSLNSRLLSQYDGIFVLKKGRIEESGTFSELMERKGYFYALYTVAQ